MGGRKQKAFDRRGACIGRGRDRGEQEKKPTWRDRNVKPKNWAANLYLQLKGYSSSLFPQRRRGRENKATEGAQSPLYPPAITWGESLHKKKEEARMAFK